MRIRFSLLLLLVTMLALGCATVQQQIGKVALKVMTKKEADLSKIAAIGLYQNNIYSPDIGITTLGTEDWLEGEHLVGVQLVKPEGKVGLIALDGSVTIDDQEAKSYGGGAYYARFEKNDLKPRTIKVVSSNGDESSFKMYPLPSIKITKVNNSTQNPTINLEQPLEIELEYGEELDGSRIEIALITKAVGAKGFAKFQSVPIARKITIPVESFQHKSITGGGPTGKDVSNWVVGENHLQVSVVQQDRSNENHPFSYFRADQITMDTVPVTIEGKSDGRSYVRIRGNSMEENGEFMFDAYASNAWYSRPLNTNIKRFGVSSLSISGTLYKKEVETTEKDEYMMGYKGYDKYRTITTTTTTFEFPKLDDRYWNQFLENMYSDIEELLHQKYNIYVVSVDQITVHPIYAEFYTPEDENTKEYIAKNLRNTKRLVANKFGEIVSERTTELIADNATMARLQRALNLDGTLSITINYQVAADENDKIVLLPTVNFVIEGHTQANDGKTNTWLQGSVRGPGVSFNRTELNDLNALNRIGQKDTILKLIEKAFDEISSEQQKFGFQKVWNVAIADD